MINYITKLKYPVVVIRLTVYSLHTIISGYYHQIVIDPYLTIIIGNGCILSDAFNL